MKLAKNDRGLKPNERSTAFSVFLDTIPYEFIRISDGLGGGSRSLEGSLAVAVGAFAVLVAAEGLAGGTFVLASAAVALAVALVEAVSPRGLDNFTVPLVAAVGLTLARPVLGA